MGWQQQFPSWLNFAFTEKNCKNMHKLHVAWTYKSPFPVFEHTLKIRTYIPFKLVFSCINSTIIYFQMTCLSQIISPWTMKFKVTTPVVLRKFVWALLTHALLIIPSEFKVHYFGKILPTSLKNALSINAFKHLNRKRCSWTITTLSYVLLSQVIFPLFTCSRLYLPFRGDTETNRLRRVDICDEID